MQGFFFIQLHLHEHLFGMNSRKKAPIFFPCGWQNSILLCLICYFIDKTHKFLSFNIVWYYKLKMNKSNGAFIQKLYFTNANQREGWKWSIFNRKFTSHFWFSDRRIFSNAKKTIVKIKWILNCEIFPLSK